MDDIVLYTDILENITVGSETNPIYIENGEFRPCFTGEDGDMGLQGIQGAQGVQGLIGPRGTQGTRGPQGPQGVQGYKGYQGAQGSRGNIGDGGADGAQGLQGAQGNRGAKGSQGTRGKNGIQGEAGTNGVQGPQGIRGENGIQGRAGQNGQPGIQGEIGTQGVQGPTGLKGTRGSQGTRGEKGDVGSIGAQGLQGEKGAQGLRGVQGVNGQQGYKGFQGANGIQGLRGDNGAEGIQGYQGNKGVQGNKGIKGENGPQGPQGIQGDTGIKGYKGVQGSRGEIGDTGLAGSQGIQGKDGPQGPKGSQGIRGCDGAQGTPGSKGIQGPQGQRGENGPQGIRGCDGAQGVPGSKGIQGPQGPRGKTGPKGPMGYMGYQGPDGDVGIQGLQGAQGTIWHDGIRLNGYNTHFFVYDNVEGKFIPAYKGVYERENNLLSIKNGATIKLWIDENSYNFIVNNDGRIKINDYIGDNTFVVSQYVAYYVDDTLLTDKVGETDFNGVIELTFKDDVDDDKEGAWYYSGGIGADSVFTDSFTVLGMNIGQMVQGTPVNVGEKIETVVRKMLTKIVDVTYVNPEATIKTNIPLNIDYEVGSTLSFTMDYDYSDGYFESSDKESYPDILFDEINGTHDGKLDANCVCVNVNYYLNNNPVSENVNIDAILEKQYTVQCVCDYNESTSVAKKNNTEDSDAVIINGTTKLSSIVFNGKYKAFYGIIENIVSDQEKPYSNVFTTTSSLSTLDYVYINHTGDTLIAKSITSTDAKPAIVLVIPSFVEIASVRNIFGKLPNPYDRFKEQNSINYNINGLTTTYKVYVMDNLIGIEYKNITISRW